MTRAQQNATDALAIVDIIEPSARVSAWPATPAWWLAIVMSALLLAVLIHQGIRFWRRGVVKRFAQKRLRALHAQYNEHQNASVFLEATAQLIRQVCLTRYPRRRVAKLTGRDWLAFLDQTGNTNEFSRGVGAELETQRFQRHVTVNSAELMRIVNQWLKHQC